jgi:hypothetical protein
VARQALVELIFPFAGGSFRPVAKQPSPALLPKVNPMFIPGVEAIATSPLNRRKLVDQ